MIVIKVCMWPVGDESREVEFGRMIITNQEYTTFATSGKEGDYSVVLKGGVYGRSDLYAKTWKTGKVLGFDRVKRGGWDLIRTALNNVLGL